MLKYREMTKDDNAAVAKLIRKNLEKHKLDIPGTVYFDKGLDQLSDYYGADERRYFVIEDAQEKVIGGVGFAKLDFMEETAELQKLYLDDSAKGSGLGYELIALIEEKMRDAGYQYSYLETHDNLQAAIHIYEKSGYIEIERPKEVVHSSMNRFFKKRLR
ncbi:GNAT family N-acetyltransferase [Butyrivibrio sp.]|uniref:GNAT family N-acetyltransferase n=1 Tax=Butyrivibrio sp. TaxID=28121 RepID=UPI0025B84C5D|nr:GNAT family N-acetyltransferase [Butyrivibrio sp.]MBE5838418.1 GNAT family N-acetyltransferase [Butyrivibrio sp.]